MPPSDESLALQRLIDEDAAGQLRRGWGSMARLGAEDSVPVVEWVDGVQRRLEMPQPLRTWKGTHEHY